MHWGDNRILRAAAALLLSFGAGPALAATTWTLIDVGTLGGPGSYGAAISNSGIVAGCADTAAGPAHAFIYSNGEMHDLGEPGSGQSCALAVNNDGVVAGRSSTGELAIWSGSSVTRLGVEGDVGGIDDRGVVVGSYRRGASSLAFMFENGVLVSLGALGADPDAGSSAARINARHQIVGSSNGRAFLYENGAMRDLGTLGGNGSSAKGLNDRGEIVGMSTDSNAQPRPFIFDGAMRALPGPGYSGAIAINNSGQVIGSAEGSYGYLLEADKYTRLDTLSPVVAKGWRHLEPTGINDRGWIVGTAMTRSGDLRAFILIPGGREAPIAALLLGHSASRSRD
jgi:probable HAF family extracellular repeat protein